ncbi:MAG: bifunctional 3-deoxy-7-phosphoheptulonate synthase/chorismate mutase type II, partial [Bacteroidaceae bacterium]|nr:bifunctional 3-deoxy-7-phosphoheptulonate synthase/chorismate mutase type II [Bacteroidaceae bacterium]
ALPICCDPSHIGGRRDLIAPLCQQAMDLGFDGLLVESHCSPDDATTHAAQQVTPDILDYILSMLVIREKVDLTEDLASLRKKIDEVDNDLIELLARRMRISRKMGEYKKEKGMTIVQPKRYTEILDKRGAQGSLLGIAPECVKNIFEHIHEESVRQQMEVINRG